MIRRFHIHRPASRLRLFNDVLTGVIIVFALYLILTPYIPALNWWIKHQAPLISKPATVTLPAKAPADNALIIPSIGLTQTIHEGANYWVLHFGVWHLPGTGNPVSGGNMVMAGHRFTYSDPAVFYNLDKVKLNNPIVIYWDSKKYDYKVTNIRAVLPTDVNVAAPTAKPQLTIYTCTPLWTTKYRLIVQATPVKPAKEAL